MKKEYTITTIKSDCGGEFNNIAFDDFYKIMVVNITS